MAAPTSTTEAPTRYRPSPYTWQRSPAPALALGGGAGTTLAALIAPTINQSWMAVGTRQSAAGVPVATVWTSPDGVTWRSSPIDAIPMADSASAAAQYRGQTVVVGSVGQGANRQAAVWISPSPGASFAAVSVPSTGGPSEMSVVAVGALGMFAVGTVDGRFAMWSSTDGRDWQEQPAAEKIVTASAGARVWAMLAEGDNMYAAGSLGSGAAQQAAMWSTSDGLHWHRVTTAATAFAGPGSRVIYSLAALGNGLVAAGAVNRGSGWTAASWVSPDGASWSLPSTDFPGAAAAGPPGAPPFGSSGGYAIRSVSAVPTFAGSAAVVAAGGGPYGQGAWRSTDGLHWSAIALPGTDAAATGWRATLAAASITTTVVADGDPGQAHLITDTGSGWSEPSSNPAAFGPVRPAAVPVSLQLAGNRLVLTVRVVSAPQAIGDPAVSYTTLASADAVDWTTRPAGAAGPPTVPTAGALTVHLPAGWVAVGQPAAGQPEGWYSQDGRTWVAQGLLDASLPPGSQGAGSSTGAGGGTGGSAPSLATTVNGLCSLTAQLAAPAVAATATTTTTAPGRSSVVAAVGSQLRPPTTGTGVGGGSVQGHQAVAWVSTGGTGWKRATVSPAAATGGFETMSGCARSADGLVAWGGATTAGGASAPAIWRSTTGAAWNRVDVTAFDRGSPSPLTDLAAYANVQLAVADPDPADGPVATSPAPTAGAAGATTPAPTGPAATGASAGAVGPSPTLENGEGGLWLSTDSGSSWQAVDTATPPWVGTDGSRAVLVGFAGSTPVVVGSVDGRLAVWTGAPAGASPVAGS